MRRSEWIVGLVYLGVLAVLPLLGHAWRLGGERTCAYDGGKIEPLYRVRVRDDRGREMEFCCIHCAESWLRREKAKPRAVLVTDEASGEEVEASSATFVRSLLVTNQTTGNRVHAFRSAIDAEKHARFSGGQLLDASERPFAGCACSACPACRDPR